MVTVFVPLVPLALTPLPTKFSFDAFPVRSEPSSATVRSGGNVVGVAETRVHGTVITLAAHLMRFVSVSFFSGSPLADTSLTSISSAPATVESVSVAVGNAWSTMSPAFCVATVRLILLRM